MRHAVRPLGCVRPYKAVYKPLKSGTRRRTPCAPWCRPPPCPHCSRRRIANTLSTPRVCGLTRAPCNSAVVHGTFRIRRPIEPTRARPPYNSMGPMLDSTSRTGWPVYRAGHDPKVRDGFSSPLAWRHSGCSFRSSRYDTAPPPTLTTAFLRLVVRRSPCRTCANPSTRFRPISSSFTTMNINQIRCLSGALPRPRETDQQARRQLPSRMQNRLQGRQRRAQVAKAGWLFA